MMDAVGSGRGASEAPGLGSDRPVTAREAVDKMVQAGMLDDLMNQVDSGDLQLTGEGGFLPELVNRVLEAGLQAELTDHLGYERHDRAGHGQLPQWLHREAIGHRGRRDGSGDAAGPAGQLRAAAGAEGATPGRWAVGDDHQLVCGWHDDSGYSGPSGTHLGHRTIPRDDLQYHRRG